MKSKSVFFLALCVILGLFGSVVLAQDEGPTLESVTADPATYYGQEVTLEGTISELVNVRSFILDEDALLDNDQLLVINNSGREFDLRVTAGQRVTVTGIVHPNYAEGGLNEISTVGMMDPVDTADTMETPMADMTEEPMMEATEDLMATPMMEATEDLTADVTLTPMADTEMSNGMDDGMYNLSTMTIRDDLGNYTLLEITSIDSVSYIDAE